MRFEAICNLFCEKKSNDDRLSHFRASLLAKVATTPCLEAPKEHYTNLFQRLFFSGSREIFYNHITRRCVLRLYIDSSILLSADVFGVIVSSLRSERRHFSLYNFVGCGECLMKISHAQPQLAIDTPTRPSCFLERCKRCLSL